MTKLFARTPLLRLALVVLLGMALIAAAPAVPSQAAPARSQALQPGRFMLGANLPWVSYGNDFGSNAWHPEGGVYRRQERAKLDGVLARLERQGVRHIRWFMLCDGRSGIRFAADGTPLGLDDAFFRDVDAALESAQQHNVKVLFTLLDFLLLSKPEVVNGVQMFGRADLVRDPVRRQALLDKVLKPILQRYGKHPAVLAWDVMNEPEWATHEIGAQEAVYSVSPDTMRSFLGQAIAYVHRYTAQQATVGSASTRYLYLVKGLGLDFYQVHWYDHFEADQPLARRVAALKLDRPVILGEFPTRGSQKSTAAILDTVYQAGYSGAMPWGVLSDDNRSGYDEIESSVSEWARRHADRLG